MRGVAGLTRALMPVSFGKVSFDYKVRQFLGAHASITRGRITTGGRSSPKTRSSSSCIPTSGRDVAAHDPFDEFAVFNQEIAARPFLDRALYVDVKTWLADDILVKADRASMAHALELRAPFLDYRIVEFAASLPSEWKLKGTRRNTCSS